MCLISTMIEAIKDFDINLSMKQQEKFQLYYELLVHWNTKMNLTTITAPEEVAVKHFADSLSILKYIDIPKNAKVVDVGTGAGFPGIPLKIIRDDIELTLLDSLNKRLIFLQEVDNQLGLNAQTIHSRAEEGGQNPQLREQFDIATSRAVARLNLLGEYCLPYVKVGGKFIAMKGPDAQEEINDAKNAINILGGKLQKANEFSLCDGSKRTILAIEKTSKTNQKYPRHGSKIKAKPL